MPEPIDREPSIPKVMGLLVCALLLLVFVFLNLAESARQRLNGLWLRLADGSRTVVVRGLAVPFTFGFSFAFSLGIGILSASILTGHWKTDHYANQVRFGYWSTAYWSLSLITVLPIVAGASLACLVEVSRGLPERRRDRVLLLMSGLAGSAIAAIRVLGEAYRHLHPLDASSLPPGAPAYCQWNDVFCGTEANNGFSWGFVFVAYAVVLTVSAVGHAALLATVALGPRLSRAEGIHAVRFLRIAFVAYLWHAVLIRTSKVEAHFVVTNQEMMCDTKVLQIWGCAKPYLEFMSSDFWTTVVMLTGTGFLVRLAEARTTAQRPSAQPELEFIERMLVGGLPMTRLGKLLLGVAAVGVVLPPPNRSIMLASMLALWGGLLVKEAALAKAE